MNAERKILDYNVGALVIFVISVGLAVVIYSMNIIPLDIFNIPAWLLGPLGVYTIIFSFMAGKESTYYLVWGIIMFAIAAASAFYNVVNAFVVLGILLIVIAVIGIVAYWRSKK
ncbi:MAG: hypothetical protein QHH17_00470 [Candidatus Bathyarchaeota archaeon]|jgi:hypothetical protein|nr:hypothetical protein [Candidatus Bathyarchaeota archaeon]